MIVIGQGLCKLKYFKFEKSLTNMFFRKTFGGKQHFSIGLKYSIKGTVPVIISDPPLKR